MGASRKKYYTNGIITRRFNEGEQPEGFWPGNNKKGIKTNKHPGNYGMHYFNNGEKEVFAYECPKGFKEGRLPFSEETKRKIGIGNKGCIRSEEANEKNRQWHLTHKYIINAWNKGKKLGPRSEEVKKKISLKNSGQKRPPRSQEAKLKTIETKRKNNSFNTSKEETEIYKYLKKKFGSKNVLNEYRDERYPFSCDFYIKSLDLFIELNLHWTHGKHPYNEELDKETLNNWLEKAKTSRFYEQAINTWTVRDVKKIQTANDNKLNYLLVYNINELYNYIKEKGF